MDEAATVKAIERKRVRALVSADLALARELHADDFQLITPTGDALSKNEYLDLIESGAFQYTVWEPVEIDVRLYQDAAVIRYQSKIAALIRGDELPQLRLWHTDLYERRERGWQIVWSQATEIR